MRFDLRCSDDLADLTAYLAGRRVCRRKNSDQALQGILLPAAVLAAGCRSSRM
jgi:hypothetical protein